MPLGNHQSPLKKWVDAPESISVLNACAPYGASPAVLRRYGASRVSCTPPSEAVAAGLCPVAAGHAQAMSAPRGPAASRSGPGRPRAVRACEWLPGRSVSSVDGRYAISQCAFAMLTDSAACAAVGSACTLPRMASPATANATWRWLAASRQRAYAPRATCCASPPHMLRAMAAIDPMVDSVCIGSPTCSSRA